MKIKVDTLMLIIQQMAMIIRIIIVKIMMVGHEINAPEGQFVSYSYYYQDSPRPNQLLLGIPT